MKLQRIIVTVVFITILGMCGTVFAENTAQTNFIYDASRMDVGTLYTYKFSDYDEKNETLSYMYISGPNEIQFLENDYPIGSPDIASMVMNFDSVTMMPKSFLVKNLLPSDNSFVFSEVEADFPNKTYKNKNEVLKNGKPKQSEGSWTFDMIPYFYMGNSFVDFAYAFRFLAKQESSFVIGLEAVGRASEMTVVYKGLEKINGINTFKYLLQGKGVLAKLFKVNGGIWIADDETHALVKAEMNVRTSWSIPNTRIVLADKKIITVQDWEELKTLVVDKQKRSLAF